MKEVTNVEMMKVREIDSPKTHYKRGQELIIEREKDRLCLMCGKPLKDWSKIHYHFCVNCREDILDERSRKTLHHIKWVLNWEKLDELLNKGGKHGNKKRCRTR